MKWLKKMFEKKQVMVRNIKPMEEEEMKQVMAGVGEENPLWRVMMQVLQEHIENAEYMVSDYNRRDAAPFHAGGLEQLFSVRTRLVELRGKDISR